MENSGGFTLSFSRNGIDRDAFLTFCGAKSGRDCDKVAEASLTPHFTELGNPAIQRSKAGARVPETLR
ncbi:MAG: hypothetical protein MZV63_31065 [Marinilabiliales bacterium]|nr:hypothetical protein [Marinilabiliales bacterium]